jgi:hypothetical protein
MRALSPLAAITLIWSIEQQVEMQVVSQKLDLSKILYFAFSFAISGVTFLFSFVEAKSGVGEFSTLVEI